MENFFIYFLKSSGLLVAFWLCFRLFLKRETFFQHHRMFLLFGVLTSFFLPLWQLKKIVFVAPTQFQNLNYLITTETSAIAEEPMNWFKVFLVVYLIGILIFSLRFAIQFFSLKSMLNKCTFENEGKYKIATTTEMVNPFSFFNIIVYNPKMYDSEAIKAILVHEKNHADQKHSIDSIIAHILCILQWINPFAWLYKKDIVQNLEFIADKNSVAQLENKKNYQYLLLHQSGQYQNGTTITNPFFNSLIKKRIVMLNQSKSKQINLLKYTLITPLLVAFLAFFNTKTIAQVKEINKTISGQDYTLEISQIAISIDKNSSDENLTKNSKFVQEKSKVDLKFSKIKRNKQGEIIAIKATYKSEDGQSGTYNISSDDPIEPFIFSIEMNQDKSIESIAFKQKEVENENSFIFHSNEATDGDEATKIIKATSRSNVLIESDDIENDSIFKGIDVSSIKKMNVIKNKSGKGGKIEIEFIEEEFNDPNTVKQIELPASSQKFSWYTKEENLKPLVVIDGKESNLDFNLNTIKPEDIEHINILKGEGAFSKYGEKAKNGVLEITLKQGPWKVVENSFKVEATYTDDSYEDAILDISTYINANIPNPTIFVNGKNMGKDYGAIKMKFLDIEYISSNPANEFTIKKYGAIGKDGVIEIITKKK